MKNIKYIKYILIAFVGISFLAGCAKPAKFEVKDLVLADFEVDLYPSVAAKGTLFGSALHASINNMTNNRPQTATSGIPNDYPVNVYIRLNNEAIVDNYSYADPIAIGDLKPLGRSTILASEYIRVKDAKLNIAKKLKFQVPISFKFVFDGTNVGRPNVVADHTETGVTLIFKYGKNINEELKLEIKPDPTNKTVGYKIKDLSGVTKTENMAKITKDANGKIKIKKVIQDDCKADALGTIAGIIGIEGDAVRTCDQTGVK